MSSSDKFPRQNQPSEAPTSHRPRGTFDLSDKVQDLGVHARGAAEGVVAVDGQRDRLVGSGEGSLKDT